MPGTCDGKDTQTQLIGATPLSATAAAGPQEPCDPNFCALEASGRKCPPGLCGLSGTYRPKRQCPPLLPGPAAEAAPAARAPYATMKVKGSPEKILAERQKAAGRIRPKLDALVKALEDARRAGALADDERELVDVLKRWGKALPRVRRRPGR